MRFMFKLPKFSKTQILIGVSLGIIAFSATTGFLIWRSFVDSRVFLSQPQRNLPIADVAPAEVQPTRTRAEAFFDAVKRGERAELTITTAELNQLIATQPELATWRGKLYVDSIDHDSLKMQLSIPMQKVGITDARLSDKVLNGDIHLKAGMYNNDLKLDLIEFTQDGKPAPALIRAQLGLLFNLKTIRETYPDSAVYMDRVEALELADDQVHVVLGALVK